MKKYYRCALVTRCINWFFLGVLAALLFLMLCFGVPASGNVGGFMYAQF